MDTDDELRKLRTRIQAIRDDLDRQRPDPLYAGAGVGIWAWLAPGQTVSGASGHTLGGGTVTLLGPDGVTPLTGPNSTVAVKNAGGGVAGGSVGYTVKLGAMQDGGYSLDVAPCAAASP